MSTPEALRGSRRARIAAALSPAEWRRAGALAAAVVGLHVAGFVTLLAFVVPNHFDLGEQGVFGVGLGMTAYTLGLRHAFDADHISAIDNTTRKMMAEGRRPMTVGFYFSLGHSTVVFVLALLFSLGVRTFSGPVQDDGSALHDVTGVFGTLVSGSFLYLIAALNLVILVNVFKVFRRMRGGDCDEQELERQLNSRGLLNRIYGRFTRAVREPWHMYPLGILFGLGFDTATEVGLLFLAAGAAGAGLPWYAILCLPVLFAAGMSLLDTIDGCFMNFAYGWALSRPVRKVYYNLIITGLSVAVALLIGTIELAGVLSQQLHLHGALWRFVSSIDLNTAGFAIAGLFVVTWAVALAIWRVGRIEERWTMRGPTGPA